MNLAEMAFKFLYASEFLFPRAVINVYLVLSGLGHGGVTRMMAFRMMRSKGRDPLTLTRNSKVTDTTRIWSKLWMGKVRVICFVPTLSFGSCYSG